MNREGIITGWLAAGVVILFFVFYFYVVLGISMLSVSPDTCSFYDDGEYRYHVDNISMIEDGRYVAEKKCFVALENGTRWAKEGRICDAGSGEMYRLEKWVGPVFRETYFKGFSGTQVEYCREVSGRE